MNVKLRGELEERKRKRHVVIGTQTDANITEGEKETSLVCNIPEHHSLEDLVHGYQEQLENLKAYVKEMDESSSMDENLALLDKRAEFEALDLAINQRRQQLVNLEMSKNRRIDEIADEQAAWTESNSENELMLKVRCFT